MISDKQKQLNKFKMDVTSLKRMVQNNSIYHS